MIRSISRLWPLIFLINAGCMKGQVPLFDEDRAFSALEAQCALGPRYPGSSGHRECLDFLVRELRKYATQVVKQPFLFTDPRTGKTYTLNNIIASFGMQGDRILLCAHWDTRPIADFDPDPANRNRPVPGANDGASGVAVLLEMAKLFKAQPPEIGIDIVLFDGEDSGVEGMSETWCHGSRHFAQNRQSTYRPRYAVLLDMIGDRNLQLPIEINSWNYAQDLVDKIWSRAESLGLSAFSRDMGYEVVDDHLELLNVGIRAVNIIDFDYPYWHTVEDTPDKCSPESLGVIGRLVTHLVYD